MSNGATSASLRQLSSAHLYSGRATNSSSDLPVAGPGKVSIRKERRVLQKAPGVAVPLGFVWTSRNNNGSVKIIKQDERNKKSCEFSGQFRVKERNWSKAIVNKKTVISCKFNKHMLPTTSYQILNYVKCASFNLQFCLWLHSPALKGTQRGMETKQTLLPREG